jgi:hypothetical protein
MLMRDFDVEYRAIIFLKSGQKAVVYIKLAINKQKRLSRKPKNDLHRQGGDGDERPEKSSLFSRAMKGLRSLREKPSLKIRNSKLQRQ